MIFFNLRVGLKSVDFRIFYIFLVRKDAISALDLQHDCDVRNPWIVLNLEIQFGIKTNCKNIYLESRFIIREGGPKLKLLLRCQQTDKNTFF